MKNLKLFIFKFIFKFMEIQAENQKDSNNNKLSLLYAKINNEILIFKSDYGEQGYYFDIKLNEKEKKVKIFLTLLKKSKINTHNEDIDFIIICEEYYPEKEPKVFCFSNVIY